MLCRQRTLKRIRLLGNSRSFLLVNAISSHGSSSTSDESMAEHEWSSNYVDSWGFVGMSLQFM